MDSLLCKLCVLCVLGGAACSTTAPNRPVAKPLRVKPVAADGPITKSPMGASFTLPAGWHVERHGQTLLFQDPERELKLWMVDIKAASSDADAVAKAWKLAVPGFSREVDDIASHPDTDGWDTKTQVAYKVPVAEGRAVLGFVRSKDGIWYVNLLDAPIAAFQRRGAQLSQLLQSQKAPGLKQHSFAGRKAQALDTALAEKFDAFIELAREKTRVPGAAVVVIQGGKIVFERGYGVRRLGGKQKVTPDTAFMIGSATKALTSLMMAVQVHEGRFAWTTPMQNVLPNFRLGDADVTAQVQMQHSVCACTGLPRQDMELLYEFRNATPRTRIAQLAGMKPTTGFGETFQYSNPLVSAGGFAAAHARWPKMSLANAYARVMREAVFKPLKMSRTTFDMKKAAGGNHARPHGAYLNATYGEIPLAYERAVTSVAPAGAAWSTARELARYVQLELARGRLPNGDVYLPEAQLLERRKPRVQKSGRSHYGLALSIDDEHDLVTVGHGGNTLGFSTLMDFFPEHDLGIVVLANAQSANAFTALVKGRLLELVFAGGEEEKARQSLEYYVTERDAAVEREQQKISERPSTEWLTPYLGRFENPSLGLITIRRKGANVWLDAGEWKAQVGKYADAGQSSLAVIGPPYGGQLFQSQDDGSLLLDVGQQKYTFRRK